MFKSDKKHLCFTCYQIKLYSKFSIKNKKLDFSKCLDCKDYELKNKN